jgi:leader peptidase (prepilin peptidase)/N-methyltransferase
MAIAIVVVLVGLAVGSFLNVCIDRLPARQSLFGPRSHCATCKTPLAVRDLIPVASYLFLRGRCRYCSALIPVRVLLMEAGTGLLFLLLWWRYGPSLEMALIALVVCTLIVIAVIGWESRAVAGRLRRICNDTRRRG